MNDKVIVIGASGHGKVIADIILKSGDVLLGFLDDNVMQNSTINGAPVLGQIEDYSKYPDAKFIVAIGNDKIRENIVHKLEKVQWYTAIHPTAVTALNDVTIGEGSAVMANAVINPSAHIGKHCIINTAAVVEHDNRIGDFSHISVGTKLGGTVLIGNHAWIGIGAIVKNNVSICDNCLIGAGAVVIDNIEESGTYVGIPARKFK